MSNARNLARLLPDSSGKVPTTQIGAGSVLQVVSAYVGGAISTSGTSYVDTGLTATITPKFATSKILVLLSHGTPMKVGASDVMMKLVRNTTDLWVFGSDMINNGGGTGMYGTTAAANYTDSPATTSPVTYKTQFSNGQPAGSVYGHIAGATISLLEIAA